MSNYLADRRDIDDLVAGWMYRDLAQWDLLRGLFYPEGTIEVTWFRGLFSDFVTASEQMGASQIRTKHLMATPVVTINGDRALAETNAIIVGENNELHLGCQSHNRFFDRVERRGGEWKFVERQSIYDMGSFTFPEGIIAIESDIVAKYPVEYAALAYLLEKSGFPVDGLFATKGSELEKEIKQAGHQWLASC